MCYGEVFGDKGTMYIGVDRILCYGFLTCFVMCGCVYVLVLLCVGVLVICVLVFTVFCIVCTVFCTVSFMYIICFVCTSVRTTATE